MLGWLKEPVAVDDDDDVVDDDDDDGDDDPIAKAPEILRAN